MYQGLISFPIGHFDCRVTKVCECNEQQYMYIDSLGQVIVYHDVDRKYR